MKQEDPDLTSLRGLVRFVMRQRNVIVGFTLALTLISGLARLIKPRTYTASAAFMSQSRRPMSGASALAAQLGVLGADQGSESPQFYVDLVNRRSTLRALVDSSYVGQGELRFPNLIAYYDVGGGSHGAAVDRAVRKLRDNLAASANTKTGVVTIAATAKDPRLAQGIVQRAIDVVSSFNLERRKSQASAERDFAQQRLAQAELELREAENQQEQFLQANAVIASPRLRLESERLGRNVEMKQALYTTLAQSYEQASIDAVRDTPVLTMIENPVVPAEPDSRGLVQALVFGALGGFVLGVVVAYWRGAWALEPENESTAA